MVLETSIFSQNTYMLDKNHSRLSFSVLHFGISHVEGNFENFDANVNASKEDFTDANIEMTADVKSINTNVKMRDNDLRSPNWFDAEKYPTIFFKSKVFRKVDDKNYKLEGDLTIHGVSKFIVFDVVYNGKAFNPGVKKQIIGFTITGKLNRRDFNVIGQNPFSETVGDEVELRSNVEFIVN